MTAYRTWKRDRSRNEMPLDNAASNLEQNGLWDGEQQFGASISRQQARKLLAEGETLQTRLAWFSLGRMG